MLPDWWTSLDTWIVVTAALSAMACALVGNFLVLRRMSMMGDAISHAVLPGLAVAFLLTGSRDSLTMFVGAVAIGVVTALLVELVTRAGRIEEGASMGVVFTSLFAVGLLLIERAAHNVDLDPGCVLYGFVELTPLHTINIAGWEIPQAAVANGAILLLNILFVGLFYKELKVTSFDPDLATSLGINAKIMHYVLMSLVAATTVAAFQSVGSILVIAMLIVPAAAAWLLTDRLLPMILLGQLIAFLCAFFGHITSVEAPRWFGYDVDTTTAGMMATVAGAIFLGVWIAAPRHGYATRLLNRARLSMRIVREDILAYLYRAGERQTGEAGTVASLGEMQSMTRSTWMVRVGVAVLRRRGQLQREGAGFRLTRRGEQAARRLVRSHRLWEGYLVERMGLKPDHVHTTAERLEHITDEQMRERLLEATGSPGQDPHAKPIPPEE